MAAAGSLFFFFSIFAEKYCTALKMKGRSMKNTKQKESACIEMMETPWGKIN